MNKQQILTEIKKFTNSNDGRAPGWRAFARETGIGEYEWKGKYWAKWSDAIREAGLTPNSLTKAYSDDFLLDAFASLAKELGHLPSIPEMRLLRRTDASFPNDTVFRRFGARQALTRKILEYCEGKPEYDSVKAMCLAVVTGDQQLNASDDSHPSSEVSGYVYLLKSGRHYKIGKADDPTRRAAQVGLLLPFPTAVVHSIATDDPYGVEQYWHKRFEAKRVRGEFFNLDAKDVNAFKRWKKIL